ncbi:MAG TPA: 2-amino-4-hydroxy-6-hydroxymethyldihydropteridine diphosphokinase [Leucothrix mucor]|uniref:2-amino-4-hydroxy-6-hydroxymethyldihydropteridine pyrophosphokinase n=1 Tax=Leucothrix mucor TaxID=45248 RepID=A0A7V2T0X2_LEUMU|nr:2-amino-4-hydroxy-6-hydroxymethyldihydropteridine diphosphokinase [Leucothrix mucor]
MQKIFIGLGSNLGDSVAYLDKAVQELQAHQQIKNITLSRYYQSKPYGPQDQPDYINAVAQFETKLPAHDLLMALQKIEKNNDRVRDGKRWGARTLDLDLLLYGNMIIESETLTVPHPWICERSFVLYPLQDLSPDLVFPNGRTLEQCISKVPADEVQLISR